ncbi:unnamed protein product [Rotaria socialis]|uniref:Uncharacterized protein n=1 Tax=Rotaria socialis TaxID=392032 RepID=A0A820WGS0_9BILA|nr:unnamed protein product [Rotaria socialis]CAF3673793.1 unnamed protein product [Rotaria socialis]CAF4294275.1 unnamed protein product [Rotaria socialis]CAF4517146.1 unnamed protein product [Rotaria socialis]CAF4548945.1 unnamed protein product [Rotaria socialis]
MADKQDFSDPNTNCFSNKYVTCYSDRLVIHQYYFPIGDKTIKYSDIHSCDLLSMKELGFFNSKTWGMGLSPIWWHADFHRHSREHYILLDTRSWPKIGVTMDDNDTPIVYKLIKEKSNPKN